MSDEKITIKSFATHSNRVLNKAIRHRIKQIKAAEDGKPTSDKSIAQLRYEYDSMMNVLMERSMTAEKKPTQETWDDFASDPNR